MKRNYRSVFLLDAGALTLIMYFLAPGLTFSFALTGSIYLFLSKIIQIRPNRVLLFIIFISTIILGEIVFLYVLDLIEAFNREKRTGKLDEFFLPWLIILAIPAITFIALMLFRKKSVKEDMQ